MPNRPPGRLKTSNSSALWHLPALGRNGPEFLRRQQVPFPSQRFLGLDQIFERNHPVHLPIDFHAFRVTLQTLKIPYAQHRRQDVDHAHVGLKMQIVQSQSWRWMLEKRESLGGQPVSWIPIGECTADPRHVVFREKGTDVDVARKVGRPVGDRRVPTNDHEFDPSVSETSEQLAEILHPGSLPLVAASTPAPERRRAAATVPRPKATGWCPADPDRCPPGGPLRWHCLLDSSRA